MKRILLSVFAAALTAAYVVPANAADVTFGGQYRLRGEYRSNSDYNDDAGDSTNFWGQRVRFTADAKATDDTSVKITLQDTRIWGVANQSTDDGSGSTLDNTVDLHESYLNVKSIFGSPINLRVGRQELAYGGERLISPGDWSNNARSFDAIKFMYSTADVNVDVFTSKITERGTSGLADDSDHDFCGIYASLKMIPNNLLDLYVLHNNNLTGTAPQNLYTLGARLKGSIAGLDYIAELPYQSGENTDTVDRQGWAFTADLGYNVPSVPLRIGAGVDFATGDDTGTLDENEAFNPLYATTHGVLGYGDVAVANTWSDIFAWNVNATYKITDKTSLYAAYWNYKEDEVATGAQDDIGSEIDLSLNYKYSSNIGVLLQAARFSPGDAVTTGDDPQDWAAIQLTANF